MAGWSRNDTSQQGSVVTTSPSTETRTTSSNSSGTVDRSQTQTNTAFTMNMGKAEYAALQRLIQQLQAGGTQEQRIASGNKEQANNLIEQLIAQFSPENAKASGDALIQNALRKALETNMPAIQRSAEGAGTSASAMQGLLTNDLATRAAQEAAALGATQQTDFGQIQASLAALIGDLVKNSGNDVTDSLLQALNIAKGVNTSSTQMQRNTQSESSESTTSAVETILRSGNSVTTTPTGSDTYSKPMPVSRTPTGSGVTTARYDSSTQAGNKAIATIQDYYNSTYGTPGQKGGYVSVTQPDGSTSLTEFSPKSNKAPGSRKLVDELIATGEVSPHSTGFPLPPSLRK